MARRASASKPRLERIPASDPALLKLGTEELLLHPDRRVAADELFRRKFNKYVSKHVEQQA